MSFSEAKKKILEEEYAFLNPMQRAAVFQAEGPLLILAGAGSGKTTVLVNKIEFAIRYGNAYYGENAFVSEMDKALVEAYAETHEESVKDYVRSVIAVDGVRPENILAFTFTNKAAGELKDRLRVRLAENGDAVWAGTFHSICARILRRDIECMGYDSHFTIYDTDDQKRVIKGIVKDLGLKEKMFPAAGVAAAISKAKDKNMSADEYYAFAGNDYRLKSIAKIFEAYEAALKKNNALDFDDLILITVRMLERFEDKRRYWQHKFTHVYVDEFQDTNLLQYRLVRLLSGGYGNLTVVGDDDQSIYRFRGATIENILHFEEDYPNAKTVRLEQNYRSTSIILDTANRLIANNTERKGKNLWTASKGGADIVHCTTETEYDEARYISDEIQDLCGQGYNFSDFAVLYRNNSQSNALEDAVRRAGIPYKIVKGMKFYDRKEIQDVIAYLTLMINPKDDVKLKRIVNEPKRSIGDTTVEAVEHIANANGMPMYEVMRTADRFPQTERVAQKLLAFVGLIEDLKSEMAALLPSEFVKEVLEKTGYLALCQSQDQADGRDRAENIESLIGSIEDYETRNAGATIEGFLQEVALVSELDSIDGDGQYVTMMTMHAAKGLEFPVVFITGMEEGLFPSLRSLDEMGGIEEERRLAYVAITRAKKLLYMTNATTRHSYYSTDYHMPSRFFDEIPKEHIKNVNKSKPIKTASYYGGDYAGVRRVIERQIAAKPRANEKISAALQFAVSDRVRHATFGEGTILSARDMGGDQLVEIRFDNGQTKKFMQNFAKLEKI